MALPIKLSNYKTSLYRELVSEHFLRYYLIVMLTTNVEYICVVIASCLYRKILPHSFLKGTTHFIYYQSVAGAEADSVAGASASILSIKSAGFLANLETVVSEDSTKSKYLRPKYFEGFCIVP